MDGRVAVDATQVGNGLVQQVDVLGKLTNLRAALAACTTVAEEFVLFRYASQAKRSAANTT